MLQILYRIGDQVVNVEPNILDDDNRLIRVNTLGRVINVSEGSGGMQMVKCVWFIDQYPYYTTFEVPSTYLQMQRR